MRPLRTARHSDRPSSPGSITSSTSRSNGSASARSSAACAVADAARRRSPRGRVQAHQLADVRLVLDDQHARRSHVRSVCHRCFTRSSIASSRDGRPINRNAATGQRPLQEDSMTQTIKRLGLGIGARPSARARRRHDVIRLRIRKVRRPPAVVADPADGPGGPGVAGRGGPMRDARPDAAGTAEPDRRAARSGQGRSSIRTQDEWKALGDRAMTAHEALNDGDHRDTFDESAIRARRARTSRRWTPTWRWRGRASTARCCQILTADQQQQLKDAAGGDEGRGRHEPTGPGRAAAAIAVSDTEVAEVRRVSASLKLRRTAEALRRCSDRSRPRYFTPLCYANALTASTMCLAEMPKRSSSSSGLPLRGISRTARRCTVMPASATAAATASPMPPAA